MGKEITSEDLEKFKQDLLQEIQKLLSTRQTTIPSGWLKSSQVRTILGLSPNKLLQLRNSGLLPYSKIGRIIYFEASDIQKLLRKRKATDTD